MQFILFGGFYFGNNVEKYGKTAVFRAATARLGKYRTGSYDRIGV